MMSKKILIDSDVCLDTLTKREPFHKNSDQILLLAEQKEIQAFVSVISFSNMFYLISKWLTKKRAYHLLSRLTEIVSIAEISAHSVKDCLELEWQDFEDSIQYHSAKEHDCELIISRNTSDYQEAGIPVVTPAEFLEEFRSS